jgi:hypothetical protein
MNKIRVHGLTFKIKRPKTICDVEEGTLAAVSETERVIEIKKGISRTAYMTGLCHELVHCVLSVTGLNQRMTEEMEEALCDSFGSFLIELEEQGVIKWVK